VATEFGYSKPTLKFKSKTNVRPNTNICTKLELEGLV